VRRSGVDGRGDINAGLRRGQDGVGDGGGAPESNDRGGLEAVDLVAHGLADRVRLHEEDRRGVARRHRGAGERVREGAPVGEVDGLGVEVGGRNGGRGRVPVGALEALHILVNGGNGGELGLHRRRDGLVSPEHHDAARGEVLEREFGLEREVAGLGEQHGSAELGRSSGAAQSVREVLAGSHEGNVNTRREAALRKQGRGGVAVGARNTLDLAVGEVVGGSRDRRGDGGLSTEDDDLPRLEALQLLGDVRGDRVRLGEEHRSPLTTGNGATREGVGVVHTAGEVGHGDARVERLLGDEGGGGVAVAAADPVGLGAGRGGGPSNGEPKCSEGKRGCEGTGLPTKCDGHSSPNDDARTSTNSKNTRDVHRVRFFGPFRLCGFARDVAPKSNFPGV